MAGYTEGFAQILLRCQGSSIFFIENFCKVKHQKAGVLPFNLFSYQRKSILDFLKHRFVVYKKTRQCGVSTLAGAFALWYAMFYPYKTVLIVSKKDEDAMAFLKKNVKFVYENLPKDFHDVYGWNPPTYNEHTIVFPNGSIIKSLTCEEDTLRSNSSSLNIIDESAFIGCMDAMWSGGASCLELSSLVSHEQGLSKIGGLIDHGKLGFKRHQLNVHTDNGPKVSDASFNNGMANTKLIQTELGYELEGTLNHRIRVVDENGDYVWKFLRDVVVDDQVCLLPGGCSGKPVDFIKPIMSIINLDGMPNKACHNVVCYKCGLEYRLKVITLRKQHLNGGQYICISCSQHKAVFNPPQSITTEIAELLGYYIGDGCIKHRPKRLKLCFHPNNGKLLDKFSKILMCYNVRSVKQKGHGTIDLVANNATLVDWMLLNGLCKNYSHNASIPDIVLKSGPSILAAFLRGLFEADGTVNGTRISLTTVSKQLANQTRVALLSLGILTNTTNGGFINSKKNYKISIYNKSYAAVFHKIVGFMSEDKIRKCNNLIKHATNKNRYEHEHLVNEFCRKVLKYEYNAKYYQCIRRKRITTLLANDCLKKYPLLSLTKLGKLLGKGIILDKVQRISDGKTLTADLSVPDNNTYVANGFINHNTVMQGGNVIVISTTNGMGGWYEVTWHEAIQGNNVFHPIQIDWWDMDWVLEYIDELNGNKIRIAPRDGIRKCETKDEIEKWGAFYSPWLEEQYNVLASRNEAHKFKQEVLAEFVGSGNTVVTTDKLKHIESTLDDNYKVVDTVEYTHPITGVQTYLNFDKQLFVWAPPVLAEPDIVENGRIIKPGRPGHIYAYGVDISSGEADDYSAIVVIDLTIMEQVAELNILVLPLILEMMMDFIGRWYNNAYCVPERQGMGIPVCQSFYYNYAYANIYRMTMPGGKLSKKVGFPTTPVYKPVLNKTLLDNLGPDCITIKSRRLYQQLCIYVHKGAQTGAVDGPGNFDDLSIALALSLMGIGNAVAADQRGMIPSRNVPSNVPILSTPDVKQLNAMATVGGLNTLVPYLSTGNATSLHLTPEEELRRFTNQLGGTTIGSNFANPNLIEPSIVTKRRNTIIHRPNK